MRLAAPPWDASVTWGSTITPNAELDARTYQRVPARVRSITVGMQTITGPNIKLVNGYNLNLAVTPVAGDDGGRNQQQVAIRANPGDGLGVYPGCGDVVLPITQINNSNPDSNGRFILSTDSCYRLQRPSTVVSTSPREVAISVPDTTEAKSLATLQLFNDCGPCCSCQDYENVYEGERLLYN